ncbi:MAG: hypothetical protein AABY40_04040 [Nanoarchaeota archaeon]
MSLEIITGSLKGAYQQLQPGTMLHVDQLMNERRENNELRGRGFYTADGEVYFLDGATSKIPTLAITREAHNPVLQNIDDAVEQLTQKNNYSVLAQDAEQALAAPETVLIALPSLRLSGDNAEWRYLAIGTTPSKYGKLNEEERKLAERVYGQGADFVKNMEMLDRAKIAETRIYVLNPGYVREHAVEGAVGRASWLGEFDSVSSFDASDRDVNDRGSVCGVRRVVIAEAFREGSHERSDLSDARNQGPYQTALKAHYEALLADPEGAAKVLDDRTASGVQDIISKYYNTR